MTHPSKPLWSCPECHAGLRGHGQGPCKKTLFAETCGVMCSGGFPEPHKHTVNDEAVCDAAICLHCGWRASRAYDVRVAPRAQEGTDALLATAMDLLENVEPAEACEHSFKHYHNPAVTYVNVLFTAALKIKLYIISPDWPGTSDGYLVNPHDHAYDFTTWALHGSVTHVMFAGGRLDDPRYNAFRFESPLRGGAGFSSASVKCNLKPICKSFARGEQWRLNADIPHTIIPSRVGPTVLLQFQQADRKERSHLFTREATPPPLTGLYTPMTVDEVSYELVNVRGLLHRGSIVRAR